MDPSPSLVAVIVPGPREAWERAGFSVGKHGFAAGPLAVEVSQGAGSLSFDRQRVTIDGLAGPTEHLAAGDFPADHRNGVTGVDHVVITTGDLGRSRAAFERDGLQCRRTRATRIAGRAAEQSFYLAGPCLLELVGFPDEHGSNRASLWGITFVCEEISALPALEPAPVASIRDAVQPGRRIAVARPELGLSVNVAFMDERNDSQ